MSYSVHSILTHYPLPSAPLFLSIHLTKALTLLRNQGGVSILTLASWCGSGRLHSDDQGRQVTVVGHQNISIFANPKHKHHHFHYFLLAQEYWMSMAYPISRVRPPTLSHTSRTHHISAASEPTKTRLPPFQRRGGRGQRRAANTCRIGGVALGLRCVGVGREGFDVSGG